MSRFNIYGGIFIFIFYFIFLDNNQGLTMSLIALDIRSLTKYESPSQTVTYEAREYISHISCVWFFLSTRSLWLIHIWSTQSKEGRDMMSCEISTAHDKGPRYGKNLASVLALNCSLNAKTLPNQVAFLYLIKMPPSYHASPLPLRRIPPVINRARCGVLRKLTVCT